MSLIKISSSKKIKNDTIVKNDDIKLSVSLIIESKLQTKIWRQKQQWYKNGKSNECEIYQRQLIEEITNLKCNKTNQRINMVNLEITNKSNPLHDNDGFEWSEDFDGLIVEKNINYLFNLKFICGQGGSQTRSLREVYHFIKSQLDLLLKNKNNNTYFINILDGDICFKNMDKFNYLLDKKEYINVKKYLFISDMYNFKKFWNMIK